MVARDCYDGIGMLYSIWSYLDDHIHSYLLAGQARRESEDFRSQLSQSETAQLQFDWTAVLHLTTPLLMIRLIRINVRYDSNPKFWLGSGHSEHTLPDHEPDKGSDYGCIECGCSMLLPRLGNGGISELSTIRPSRCMCVT